eukprot:CAMPEP_0170551110 /NCGR_PEP_ID=MMETSP0211-20121228/9134_1 /TAXON_ID=311385 /ORGANISM="Pseudokeronopsis sp., Strain OXSARD2" /LENGTH=72 /DNA_ID=CAMNT_0010858077 /DNA_START=86 /DNA_END=304 /DNA_ORIENTATION=+
MSILIRKVHDVPLKRVLMTRISIKAKKQINYFFKVALDCPLKGSCSQIVFEVGLVMVLFKHLEQVHHLIVFD